jgi:sodium/hydrogen antiporter
MVRVLGIALLLGIVLVWALTARRLESWSITTAIAIVIAAILLTGGRHPPIHIALDTHITERVVEVTLAMLLFVDANEVPASMVARERKVLARLLMIAFPLSLILAWAVGLLLFPGRNIWLVLVLAVIVVPLDLAPAPALVRDRRIPQRLRDLLNLESGFNDGLVAPLFLLAVAAANVHGGAPGVSALEHALPAIASDVGIAVGIGAAVGLTGAKALNLSWRREWTQPAALRVGVLALPLLTYVLSIRFGGNGFVAAFVAGVVFAVCRRELPAEALNLTEDTVLMLSLVVWFLFGNVVTQVFDTGLTFEVVVYSVLALVVFRSLPVVLSLRGSNLPRPDALFLGLMGPRGLASLVFGLLAAIELTGGAETLAEQVMVVTVLLSVIVHGASALPVAAAFGRRHKRESASEPQAAAPTEPAPTAVASRS